MAEEEKEEALTEEQRIKQLELSVSTNKILLFAVGLMLIIGVSVGITSFVVFVVGDDEVAIDVETFNALSAEVAELKASIEQKDQNIAEFLETIPQLKGAVKNSSSAVLKQVALEQEQNNQLFLKALKTGMKDLAFMVPGSRTWFELYEEQLTGVIEASEAREKKLKELNKGVMVYDELEF